MGVLAGAGVAGLIAACTPAASSAAPTSPPAAGAKPAAGSTPAAVKSSALPSYVPLTNVPKPDYHSSESRVSDGYDNYPKPYKSWTKEPPGTGSTVNVYAAG